MKLSTKARYGLYACVQLAESYNNGYSTISDIASKISVSEKYLEQIISLLKKHDIVTATRGAKGGYTLTCAPQQITIGRLMRALEDDLRIVDCIGSKCNSQRECAAFSVFNKLYGDINICLDSMTLSSLCDSSKKSVYLDHSATTPCDRQVLSEMLPYFCDNYGNAHSLHSFGKTCAIAVDRARHQVATAIGARHDSEIYFTGSGSEANSWAIKGTAYAMREKGNHIIVSAIEHPSIMNSAKALAEEGFEVSFLPVDQYGVVELDELKKLISPKTTLVSIMLANNEVGTIQPIKEISEICRQNKVLLHCDCVQAVGSIPVNVNQLNVDMCTISAHKFYGPKGVGALYIRTGVKISRLIFGGGQERTQRGGTTATPLIVGMGCAIEKACADMVKNSTYVASLRDRFVAGVMKSIPFIKYNGHPTNRLCSNANFSFEFIEGEGILMLLDFARIAVSSGSACSSDSLEPSHVLLAMGVETALAHGSIRFSFGKDNTTEEVDYTVKQLAESVAKLRELSPLFKMNKGEVKYV